MTLVGDTAPAEAPAAGASTGTVPATRAGRGAALLSATNLVVAGANYAFSLLLVRVLAAQDYVAYASVQSLLLVLGSGAMAAVPWAVARHVAAGHDGDRHDGNRHDGTGRDAAGPGGGAAAGRALGFGLTAATVQGVVFALVTWAVVLATSGPRLALPAAAAAFALSVVVAPLGVLQGQGRITEISVLRLGETVVRIGLSIGLLVAFGADPASPVTGFAVASALLFVAAVALVRGAFPLRVSGFGPMASRALRLGGVQLCLASLGAADTVVAAAIGAAAGDAAAYQVAALLGRVPLFVASAVALSYYTDIAASDVRDVGAHVRRAVRLLLVLTLPVAVLVASTPAALVALVADRAADAVRPLLAPTAVAGLGVAVVTVLVTALQARDEHRDALRVVLPAALAQPVVLLVVGRTLPVGWYAAANALLVAVTVAVLVHRTRAWRPWRAVPRQDARRLVALAVCGAVAVAWSPAWWPAAVLAGHVTLRALRRRDDDPPVSRPGAPAPGC